MFQGKCLRVSVIGSVFAASALLAGACAQTPGTPSVSFGAPGAAGPSNGTSFKYSAQPVTLTLTNAVRTSPATATYAVEVATDTGFGNKVFTKTDIAEGDGPTTSVQLSQLAGATTYYWRSMTTIDGITGAPSTAQTFAIGPQVVVNIPSPLTPETNGTASGARPTFTVASAGRSGPAGTIFYEFQVSTSSSFGSLLASGTVQEQTGQTSWSPTSDLTEGTYFWRAQALDQSNDVRSGFSSPRPFTLEPFDMKKAVIWNNPANLGSWEETAKITLVDTTSFAVEVDFDRREGPGAWPETPFGDGGPGTTQYTLGICAKIGGVWHCSAVIQFWAGRELTAGGHPNLLGEDWFYDSRWGAMAGYQPRAGETVGIFVANGNIRDSRHWAREQRSNVQFVQWRTLWRR